MRIIKQWKWLAGLMALMLLTGCQSQTQTVQPRATDDPTQVVYASFYPIYALSSVILQDVPDMQLRQLVQPQDGCLRSYQMSDWDLYQVFYNADAVIIGGRGLETFASTLQNMGEDGPAVVTLLQNLTLDNNGVQAADEDASHLMDENPHLYLSARALPDIFESLHAYMQELDPMYAEMYDQNLDNALRLGDELIAETNRVQSAIDPAIPVALMNEALIYPAQDLGLNVACRIDRESGTNLYGNELDDALATLLEQQIEVVLIERQAPDALVNVLRDNGFSVVKLDILSTGRAEMGYEGYFAAMQENLSAIEAALKKN